MSVAAVDMIPPTTHRAAASRRRNWNKFPIFAVSESRLALNVSVARYASARLPAVVDNAKCWRSGAETCYGSAAAKTAEVKENTAMWKLTQFGSV
jgi:hypothetical protein